MAIYYNNSLLPYRYKSSLYFTDVSDPTIVPAPRDELIMTEVTWRDIVPEFFSQRCIRLTHDEGRVVRVHVHFTAWHVLVHHEEQACSPFQRRRDV